MSDSSSDEQVVDDDKAARKAAKKAAKALRRAKREGDYAGGQKACGSPTVQGHYFNTQIAPFATGPMALAGFTWYQAEADTKDEASAKAYACAFPALVQGWRAAFQDPQEEA